MDNKEVLTYKDCVLRRTDLDLLEGPCYLNDQIIGFYSTYLTSVFNCKDILLVPPSVSFWLANCGDEEIAKACAKDLEFSGKCMILFTINNNNDLSGSESGTHWSMMAYDRKMNAFVHHDNMEGVNNLDAMKLFDAIKDFMVTTQSSTKLSTSKSKNKKKKKDKGSVTTKAVLGAAPFAKPCCFLEGPTPQQSNGYDCGLYVMGIARAICQWYTSQHKSKEDNWFSAIEEHVTVSLELNMRTEVLRLIEQLKANS